MKQNLDYSKDASINLAFLIMITAFLLSSSVYSLEGFLDLHLKLDGMVLNTLDRWTGYYGYPWLIMLAVQLGLLFKMISPFLLISPIALIIIFITIFYLHFKKLLPIKDPFLIKSLVESLKSFVVILLCLFICLSIYIAFVGALHFTSSLYPHQQPNQ